MLAGFAAHQANIQALKRWLMILKTIELALALISAIAIYFKLGWLLLLCIAGFGVQSALIGPLKYALIPQLTNQADLLNKNAWMESATFVAILIGTLIASDWIQLRSPPDHSDFTDGLYRVNWRFFPSPLRRETGS